MYMCVYMYKYICIYLPTQPHSSRHGPQRAQPALRPQHTATQRADTYNQKHVPTPHVENAERGYESGMLFIFSPFCEYGHLENGGICVIYRV